MKSGIRAGRLLRLGWGSLLAVLCLAPLLRAQTPGTAPGTLLARADTLLADGYTTAARLAYEQVANRPDIDDDARVTALIGMARVAIEDEDWKEAGNRLEAALELDPDRLETHYYLGIQYRERARPFPYFEERFRPSRRYVDDWIRGINAFETVLQRDSTYRDVLFQYALLWRYAGQHDRAIRLGERYVQLHPDEPRAPHNLFGLYRAYLYDERTSRAARWLGEHESPFSTYFQGELLRREGNLEAAETVFEALLSKGSTFSKPPVLQSLARIAYTRGREEAGEAFVMEAIDAIEDDGDALLVFEDAKYIVTEEELETFRQLETPAAYKDFFRSFWTRRDPLPAKTVNVRLAKHYHRLLKAERDYAYDGLRMWYDDPDRFGELEYPETYELGLEFNDMGLIYLRHGEPDDYIRHNPTMVATDLQSTVGNVNESWRYYSPERMDFHFVRPGGSNNWRLVPSIVPNTVGFARVGPFGATEAGDPLVYLLESRERWSGIYADLANSYRAGDIMNVRAISQRMKQNSRRAAMLGLTTDRHDWGDDLVTFDFPHLTAAFRDTEGRTRYEVHYGYPIGRLLNRLPDVPPDFQIETGCALLDSDWLEVDAARVVQGVPDQAGSTATLTGLCRLSAPPGAYHVGIHSQGLETPLLTGYAFDADLPDYTLSVLQMSDVLPAFHIAPAQGPHPANRGDRFVPVNPFLQYSVQQPIWLYYEIYNLSLDTNGRTDYTIEYTLLPRDEGRRTRTDQPVLSLSFPQRGTTPAPVETAQIDVSSVQPGRYTLITRVRDRRAGTVTQRELQLTLGE